MVRRVQTGQVVVTAPAEVDIATAPELARQLDEACARRPALLVVDLSATTFCDTAALDVLLDAAARMKADGCALEIRSPSRTLCRVAGVLGLTQELGLPD